MPMFNTLRSKLILFFSCVTFLPLLLVGTIMYQYQRDDISTQMEEGLVKVLESRADGLEDFLTERRSNLEHLAKNPLIRDTDTETSEIRQELELFQTSYPYFLDTQFMNSQEVVSLHNQEQMNQIGLERPDWYIQTEQTGGGFTNLSRVLYDEPTFVISQAVYDENNMFMGSVASFVDLTEIRSQLNRVNNNQSEYAFLINSQGDIISHPNRKLVLNHNYFEMNGFDESSFTALVHSKELYFNPTNEMIQTFQQVSSLEGLDSEWYVAVSVPQDQLYASQNQLLITYLVLFSCVFVLTLFAVLKLSNFIVKPLEQLVVATATFTFSNKIDPITQGFYQEADTLTRAFKMMTTKLLNRERNHQKSSLILETTDNGVFAYTNKDQIITTFNTTCEQLFQEKRENVLGLTLKVAALKNNRLRRFLEAAELDTNSAPEIENRYEFSCTFNTQVHAFFISVSKLSGDSDLSIEQDALIVFNDVTEKKEMQQQIVRSEKSKVVGELAAGFAHEIRNPLSTIKGFLQLFQKEEQIESKKDQFRLMVNEIDRVNNIIKDLLNMARPAQIQQEKTDIKQLLDHTRQMFLAETDKRGIDFTFLNDSELPVAWVDSDKVQQVMINLVKNAMDSMPNGGELTIHTIESKTEMIGIIVQDSGVGMSREVLDRIGTPFFTTKSDGTGLGLMTCFRIAEEINGSLTVESKEGEGTCFAFQIPIYKNQPE